MDLSGTWSFQLDPQDEGVANQWYAQAFADAGVANQWYTGALADAGRQTAQIELPGSLQAQGFGDDVTVDTPWTGDIVDRAWFTEERYAKYRQPGSIKVPFWLQPEKVYSGAAWYQREVEIPEAWKHWRITLTLERAHWETRAWFDGRELGRCDSLSTPHEYVIGVEIPPGKHTITVRVDNRRIVNVGPNAHSISDHTQTNWNGLIGRIELNAGPAVRVKDVQVFPNAARKSARVVTRLENGMDREVRSSLTLQARSYNTLSPHVPAPVSQPALLPPGETTLELDYPLGASAQPWDEFNPTLYHLTATLESIPTPEEQPNAPSFSGQVEVTFGLREVAASGTQITLNGRPIFVRGTLECCIFPLTGYPSTNVEDWKRILSTARGYGLNSLRFHSWCPPEAAFQAADEEGFYLQVECAAWANLGARIGEGDPLDEWLYAEGSRIVTVYGNHPSFLFMAYGNEPAGNLDWLSEWVEYWKFRDPRRLYTTAAGWPAIPRNDYHNLPQPRIQAWEQGLASRINAKPPETLTDYRDFVQEAKKPVISHEVGQWCAYPNFAEIDKYTGFLKAKNFEIFRDSLKAHGMLDQAHDFLMASGRLQVLCYKEDIEAILRTPGLAGYFLLDLHDFPGQGTALVGVLDPFWEEKGYVSAAEYSRFCNATVPLARLEKRVWLSNEIFRARVDITHFGSQPLKAVTPQWQLTTADGTIAASGSLPTRDIAIGNGGPDLGCVEIPLAGLPAGQKYTLSVALPGVKNPNHRPVENDWEIWVYPAEVDTAIPQDILVTGELNAAARDALRVGRKVLLLLPSEQVKTSSTLGFSTVFWNTAWTQGQPPHTLGILCNPDHPLFAHFPTEFHTNWQWWELIHGAAAMQLDAMPKKLRPLVQPIDTWFENRRLGLLFEAKLHGGNLMVCSMDLTGDLPNRPVARQLLHSLLRYMSSPDFAPQISVSLEAMLSLTRS